MPRGARLNLPEVPLHIVQRGNNRQPTFFADDDYAFYLECLRDSALQHACDEPETGLRPHFLVARPVRPARCGRPRKADGRRAVT